MRIATLERLDRDGLGVMLAQHLRSERAIAAGRRWISQNCNAVLKQSDVVTFLRRRRDKLDEAALEYCAKEAIDRWLNSRANRYRGPAAAEGKR